MGKIPLVSGYDYINTDSPYNVVIFERYLRFIWGDEDDTKALAMSREDAIELAKTILKTYAVEEEN